MTTTRVYQSTDPGAPVLTGQAGTLVALLHACLVGTAGVAYGSGPTQKYSAGWSEPFSNTATKGVFRNSLGAGGTGCYVRVRDDGTNTGGAKEALQIVYSAMSDIDTGIDATPTTAQMANGAVIRKSLASDATARPWILIADELTYYLATSIDVASSAWSWTICGAGDFASEIAGDAYRFCNIGWTIENAAAGNYGSGTFQQQTFHNGYNYSPSGLWLARNYNVLAGAISIPLTLRYPAPTPYLCVGGAVSQYGVFSPGSAKRYFEPAMLVEPGAFRGYLRGMFIPWNNFSALPQGGTVSGAQGVSAGSVLLKCNVNAYVGDSRDPRYTGAVFFESVLNW